jgi:hypothetical protein
MRNSHFETRNAEVASEVVSEFVSEVVIEIVNDVSFRPCHVSVEEFHLP